MSLIKRISKVGFALSLIVVFETELIDANMQKGFTITYLYDNNKSTKTFKEQRTIFPHEINPAFYTYYDFYINKTEENKEMTRKYEM